MGRMVSITIDSDDMVEALVERVRYWTDDSADIELFEQYYEHMVDNGCFEGAEFNVMGIVDNDYVNNLSIVTRDEFEKARDKYIKEQMEADGFNEECSEEELEKAREEYEGEAPEWDDIDYGENKIEFLEGSYVEAKTDSCLLVSW